MFVHSFVTVLSDDPRVGFIRNGSPAGTIATDHRQALEHACSIASRSCCAPVSQTVPGDTRPKWYIIYGLSSCEPFPNIDDRFSLPEMQPCPVVPWLSRTSDSQNEIVSRKILPIFTLDCMHNYYVIAERSGSSSSIGDKRAAENGS